MIFPARVRSSIDDLHIPATRPARAFRPLRRRRALTLLVAAVGASFYAGCSPAATEGGIGLDEARAAHEAGKAILIDIREPEEHATGVAPGAKLLPMRQLQQRVQEIPVDPSQPVLLICRTQNRSSATLQALRKLGGYQHVRFVQGGMSEWARRGWPLVKPSK